MPFGDNTGLALTVLSLLSGVAMIFLFKRFSDQDAIKRSRDLFKARILEMRLYQDDFVLINKALGNALATNLTYLRVSLKPIAVILFFVFFIFVQMDMRFSRRALQPGDETVVTLSLKDGFDPFRNNVVLQPSGAVELASPAVRVAEPGEVNWRVRLGNVSGEEALNFTVLDKEYTAPLTTQPGVETKGRQRAANGFFDPLLYPPGLPKIRGDMPYAGLTIDYPDTDYSVFGWRTHWLVVFIIWSFVGALIPKFLFRIEV